MSRRHKLKTWPGPFTSVVDGSKPYEIRVNDRGYAVGDELLLQEFAPRTDLFPNGEYTGREHLVLVTYMTEGGAWQLPAHLCVLGIKSVRS